MPGREGIHTRGNRMINWLLSWFLAKPVNAQRLMPSGLEVQVGRLKILQEVEVIPDGHANGFYKYRPGKGGRIGFGAEVYVDGKRLERVRRLTLHIAPDELVTADVEIVA